LLPHHQLQGLNEACLELYQPDLELANFAERTFAFLSRLVPAELIAFGSLDCTTKQLEIGFNSTVASLQPAMEAFGRLMGDYDLFNWNPKVNDGKPFCRSDWFSERSFRDQPVYEEVYRPLGIDNHCGVYVPGGPNEIAFYGIERKGGPDFSTEERTMLELAQTHLGTARELVLARSRMGTDFQASPALLMRAGLTAREADVLAWLAEGKSNEEIALLLHLQLYTIKGYVKTIFQKINTPNRLAAALWALRYCWDQRHLDNGDVPGFVRVATNTPWI
jgi:DNA-binding CsgD family transcriptional regulator